MNFIKLATKFLAPAFKRYLKLSNKIWLKDSSLKGFTVEAYTSF